MGKKIDIAIMQEEIDYWQQQLDQAQGEKAKLTAKAMLAKLAEIKQKGTIEVLDN